MGLPRRSSGKESEISDMAHGLKVASPTPTDMRAMKICTKFRASPENAVAADQSATPMATIQVRRRRSARYPSGRPIVA